MKSSWVSGVAIVALAFVSALPRPAHGSTKCTLKFNLTGWSAFYKTATGSGTITCDNGQSARVKISTEGGGLTVGSSKIVNGTGTFSEVSDIKDVLGVYAAAEAHAGMVASSGAQVVTKGTVSLALAGTGQGVDLGVSFGKFTIRKRK